MQPNLANPTSTPQAVELDPTSTPQAENALHIDNLNILKLVNAVNDSELSLKEMLAAMGLKDRKSFLTLYLNPAIVAGYVRLLYPDSPRHPRQKYLLTVKGLAVYNESKQR